MSSKPFLPGNVMSAGSARLSRPVARRPRPI